MVVNFIAYASRFSAGLTMREIQIYPDQLIR